MARVYGYMENGVFTPTGGGQSDSSQGGIGQFTNDQWALLQEMLNERMGQYNRAVTQGPTLLGGNNYSVPYSNVPRYGQRFYGPGGMPTDIAVGSQFAAPGRRVGVRYNYQPRYTGNGYAPRGYNTNMNYGPWYGQQSYATYPPYAPNQPRYEWMPGSNGQPVAVRLGEYQREQPVAYETMFNSQGVPVRVPVYAPMNNSAMPVRMGTDVEGRPYGSANINSQAAFPQQRARNVQRITTTAKSAGTNLSPEGQPSSFGAALGEQTVNNALGVSTAPSYEAPSSNVPTIPVASTEVLSSVPIENATSLQNSRKAMIQSEFEKRKANQQILIDQGTLASTPLSDEEIMLQASTAVDKKILSANRTR